MAKEPKNDVIPTDNSLPPPQVRAAATFGMFETIATPPTGEPKNFLGQIKIYSNGSTYRLYWYDTTIHNWHYVSTDETSSPSSSKSPSLSPS